MAPGSAVLTVLLLAGCAGSGLPLQQAAVVPGGNFSAVQGEASLIVRTHLVDAAGDRREVGGALCTVTTSLFSAELVTPARLVAPNFGAESPALNFACRADGLEGEAQQRISVYWRGNPGYFGYPGYVGYPGYFWNGWGWNGSSYPVFEYRNVAVRLQ